MAKSIRFVISKPLFVATFILFFSSLLIAKLQADETNEILSLSFEELLNVKLKNKGKGLFIAEGLQKSLPFKKFGLIIPLTEFPLYSTELIAAADIAADYVNNHGGINGKKLMILRGDDVASVDVAVKLAKQMVDDYAVTGLIGPIESMRALTVAKEVSIPKKILMLATTASANVISDLDDNNLVYRLIATNKVLATKITDFLQAQQRQQKVLVIGDKSLYSHELETNIRDLLSKTDVSEITKLELSRLVDYSAIDLKEHIRHFNKFNPDSILLILARKQAVDVLAQINQHWQGKVPLIITFDGIKPVDLAKTNLDKVGHCISMMITESGNNSKDVFEKISQLIKQQSSIYDAAYVYDSVIILAFAHTIAEISNISSAQAITLLTGNGHPISMSDYGNISTLLKKHHEFSFFGASGRINFDTNGDNLAAKLSFRPLVNPQESKQHCPLY